MTDKAILNTDQRIFLIKFAFTMTDGKFMATQDSLANCIKEHDPKRGIEYIKEFCPSKNTFKRIAKSRILEFVSWDTESHEFLSKHPYFI